MHYLPNFPFSRITSKIKAYSRSLGYLRTFDSMKDLIGYTFLLITSSKTFLCCEFFLTTIKDLFQSSFTQLVDQNFFENEACLSIVTGGRSIVDLCLREGSHIYTSFLSNLHSFLNLLMKFLFSQISISISLLD